MIIFLGLSVTGCVSLYDPESSQEYRANIIGALTADQTLGQSFMSRRAGLSAIQLWLQVDKQNSPSDAVLTAELFNQPTDSEPLQSQSYALKDIGEGGSFTFPVQSSQPDHAGREYYLRLSTSAGQVGVFGRAEDAYPDGSAYTNGLPIDADMTFRIFYDYDHDAFLADLANWLSTLWLLIPCAILLWLPGRLVIKWTGFDRRLDGGEQTAVSIGLSISAIAILLLWTSTIGIHWYRLLVILAAIGLALIGVWVFREDLKLRKIPRVNYTNLALLGILIFSLGVRLAMVRDLAAPAWVDSVHHATLVRLILDQGTLPNSYKPYIPVNTASYHAGYHSLMAFFTWLSNLDLTDSMLIMGQILNGLMILSVYLLATTFTQNSKAGLFAALIAGLVTPMPAYYTSWGRYTQLTGLLLLPPAFVFSKYIIDKSFAGADQDRGNPKVYSWLTIPDKRNAILVTSLLWAGIFLVHYRVMAFLACLIFAYWIVKSIHEFRQPRNIRRFIFPLILLFTTFIGAVIFSLPWWPATLKTLLIPALEVTTKLRAFSDFSWSFLTTAWGKYALGLAGLGLLWGIIKRWWFPLVLALWVGMLFFLANLAAFSLPGASLVNNTSVAIILFMPISVLAGYPLGWLISGWETYVPKRLKSIYFLLLSASTIIIMIFASRAILPILNPVTMLFREADYPAMQWVEANISEEETILINPFLWGANFYAGSDGGFWISPLAGRRSLPPPVLYGLDFSGETANIVTSDVRKILDSVNDPATLHNELIAQGINYVFAGAKGGVISPKMLKDSNYFENIYQEHGVYIFKVLP